MIVSLLPQMFSKSDLCKRKGRRLLFTYTNLNSDMGLLCKFLLTETVACGAQMHNQPVTLVTPGLWVFLAFLNAFMPATGALIMRGHLQTFFVIRNVSFQLCHERDSPEPLRYLPSLFASLSFALEATFRPLWRLTVRDEERFLCRLNKLKEFRCLI